MPARVNAEKCDGCGDCIEVCPVEAIDLNAVAHVDEEECIECEGCASECPNEAISIV